MWIMGLGILCVAVHGFKSCCHNATGCTNRQKIDASKGETNSVYEEYSYMLKSVMVF